MPVIPAGGQGVPIECGASGSTVTNRGPSAVYYSDELPVSSSSSSLASGGSVELAETQFFFVASGSASLEVVPVAASGGGLPSGGTVGQTILNTAPGEGEWADTLTVGSTAPPAARGAGSAGTSDEVMRADAYAPSGVLLPSGVWVPLIYSRNAGATMTKNMECICGWDLAPQTIDRIAFRVTTAGDASAVVRIGIRADSSLQPGAPAYEETVAATSTGWKQTTAMGYQHPGGILWLSFTGQGWSATAIGLDGTADKMAGFARPWAVGPKIGASFPANMPSGGADPDNSLVASGPNTTSGALPASFVVDGYGSDRSFRHLIKRA